MIKDKQQGVTLTELLTVIVIIGILASVVLVSLDLARKRARDSTVQRQMSELRNVAEATFDWQDGYTRLDDMQSDADSELMKIKGYILDVGLEEYTDDELFDIKFSTDKNNYCAWARLVSNSEELFCVDSAGRAERGLITDYECASGSEVSCKEIVPECTVDSDCGMGEVCDGGTCVTI